MKATELTCEYLENPIGLDTRAPGFGWLIESSERSAKQNAYHILVSTDQRLLDLDSGDMWDSGKVYSARSANVPYAGVRLSSFSRYWWKVRLWDENGNKSNFSTAGLFEMGPLDPSDWKAMWIGMNDRQIEAAKEKRGARDISPILRKEIDVSKEVVEARAYFSGLGWSELYVNGEKSGDSVLDPAPTDYHKNVPYVTHDITDRLQGGKNCIGIMLGNGWFSEFDFQNSYEKAPKAILMIRIQYIDGTVESVTTDKTWKITAGPITDNRFWGGETYDARYDQSGWTMPGFDDREWIEAAGRDRGRGVMKAQIMQPIKVNETVVPVRIADAAPGVHLYDMGQLFGGWARVSLKGESGARVTIRYSDRLKTDGTIEQKWQNNSEPSSDTYILKGDPDGEYYEPRFTYHPANYVQIEADPEKVSIESVEGRKVYNSVDFSGSFSSSNSLMNKIHEAVKRTIRNELFGLPLDCLYREHWGWIDPATITGTLYARQYMPLFWKKWLVDIRESQFENGGIPDIAPNYLQWKNVDPAWGGNYPIMVWYLYQYYDDPRILEDHYDAMRRLMDYFAATADNGILTEGHYGDHMIPGPEPGKEDFISTETPPPFVWTGYYYRGAVCMANAARILGRDGDAEYYDSLATDIQTAMHDKWLDRDECRYSSGSQTTAFFALALGIVPEACKPKLVENAVTEIREKYDLHHHTGNTGTTCMIDVLTQVGYGQMLYDMVNQETYPGWGYMMAQGATTIWESWSVDNTVGCELSMSMYATIDEFFYNDLAGIGGPDYYGPEPFETGFGKIVIAPLIPDHLESAEGTIRTVKGRISSQWRKDGTKLVLEISIPPNTEGIVRIQVNGEKELTISEDQTVLWEDGGFVAGIDGINDARLISDQECIQIAIGSGRYHFIVSGWRGSD